MIGIIIGSARPVRALAEAVGRCLGAIGRWLHARRDQRTLRDMSERELRDLGLRDSALRDGTAAPFFGDPTAIISLPAEERRGLAGGDSVEEALRGPTAAAPARPERSAEDTGGAGSGLVVFLRPEDATPIPGGVPQAPRRTLARRH